MLQHTVQPFAESPVARLSPGEIRLVCQDLISQGHETLAMAVGEAAFLLYPDDQEILSITALMCVMDQDWPNAIQRMSALLQIQGVQAQEFTYVMLVRAQRCDLDPAGALKTAMAGIQRYPASADLLKEVSELSQQCADLHKTPPNNGAPASMS